MKSAYRRSVRKLLTASIIVIMLLAYLPTQAVLNLVYAGYTTPASTESKETIVLNSVEIPKLEHTAFVGVDGYFTVWYGNFVLLYDPSGSLVFNVTLPKKVLYVSLLNSSLILAVCNDTLYLIGSGGTVLRSVPAYNFSVVYSYPVQPDSFIIVGFWNGSVSIYLYNYTLDSLAELTSLNAQALLDTSFNGKDTVALLIDEGGGVHSIYVVNATSKSLTQVGSGSYATVDFVTSDVIVSIAPLTSALLAYANGTVIYEGAVEGVQYLHPIVADGFGGILAVANSTHIYIYEFDGATLKLLKLISYRAESPYLSDLAVSDAGVLALYEGEVVLYGDYGDVKAYASDPRIVDTSRIALDPATRHYAVIYGCRDDVNNRYYVIAAVHRIFNIEVRVQVNTLLLQALTEPLNVTVTLKELSGEETFDVEVVINLTHVETGASYVNSTIVHLPAGGTASTSLTLVLGSPGSYTLAVTAKGVGIGAEATYTFSTPVYVVEHKTAYFRTYAEPFKPGSSTVVVASSTQRSSVVLFNSTTLTPALTINESVGSLRFERLGDGSVIAYYSDGVCTSVYKLVNNGTSAFKFLFTVCAPWRLLTVYSDLPIVAYGSTVSNTRYSRVLDGEAVAAVVVGDLLYVLTVSETTPQHLKAYLMAPDSLQIVKVFDLGTRDVTGGLVFGVVGDPPYAVPVVITYSDIASIVGEKDVSIVAYGSRPGNDALTLLVRGTYGIYAVLVRPSEFYGLGWYTLDYGQAVINLVNISREYGISPDNAKSFSVELTYAAVSNGTHTIVIDLARDTSTVLAGSVLSIDVGDYVTVLTSATLYFLDAATLSVVSSTSVELPQPVKHACVVYSNLTSPQLYVKFDTVPMTIVRIPASVNAVNITLVNGFSKKVAYRVEVYLDNSLASYREEYVAPYSTKVLRISVDVMESGAHDVKVKVLFGNLTFSTAARVYAISTAAISEALNVTVTLYDQIVTVSDELSKVLASADVQYSGDVPVDVTLAFELVGANATYVIARNVTLSPHTSITYELTVSDVISHGVPPGAYTLVFAVYDKFSGAVLNITEVSNSFTVGQLFESATLTQYIAETELLPYKTYTLEVTVTVSGANTDINAVLDVSVTNGISTVLLAQQLITVPPNSPTKVSIPVTIPRLEPGNYTMVTTLIVDNEVVTSVSTQVTIKSVVESVSVTYAPQATVYAGQQVTLTAKVALQANFEGFERVYLTVHIESPYGTATSSTYVEPRTVDVPVTTQVTEQTLTFTVYTAMNLPGKYTVYLVFSDPVYVNGSYVNSFTVKIAEVTALDVKSAANFSCSYASSASLVNFRNYETFWMRVNVTYNGDISLYATLELNLVHNLSRISLRHVEKTFSPGELYSIDVSGTELLDKLVPPGTYGVEVVVYVNDTIVYSQILSNLTVGLLVKFTSVTMSLASASAPPHEDSLITVSIDYASNDNFEVTLVAYLYNSSWSVKLGESSYTLYSQETHAALNLPYTVPNADEGNYTIVAKLFINGVLIDAREKTMYVDKLVTDPKIEVVEAPRIVEANRTVSFTLNITYTSNVYGYVKVYIDVCRVDPSGTCVTYSYDVETLYSGSLLATVNHVLSETDYGTFAIYVRFNAYVYNSTSQTLYSESTRFEVTKFYVVGRGDVALTRYVVSDADGNIPYNTTFTVTLELTNFGTAVADYVTTIVRLRFLTSEGAVVYEESKIVQVPPLDTVKVEFGINTTDLGLGTFSMFVDLYVEYNGTVSLEGVYNLGTIHVIEAATDIVSASVAPGVYLPGDQLAVSLKVYSDLDTEATLQIYLDGPYRELVYSKEIQLSTGYQDIDVTATIPIVHEGVYYVLVKIVTPEWSDEEYCNSSIVIGKYLSVVAHSVNYSPDTIVIRPGTLNATLTVAIMLSITSNYEENAIVNYTISFVDPNNTVVAHIEKSLTIPLPTSSYSILENITVAPKVSGTYKLVIDVKFLNPASGEFETVTHIEAPVAVKLIGAPNVALIHVTSSVQPHDRLEVIVNVSELVTEYETEYTVVLRIESELASAELYRGAVSFSAGGSTNITASYTVPLTLPPSNYTLVAEVYSFGELVVRKPLATVEVREYFSVKSLYMTKAYGVTPGTTVSISVFLTYETNIEGAAIKLTLRVFGSEYTYLNTTTIGTNSVSVKFLVNVPSNATAGPHPAQLELALRDVEVTSTSIEDGVTVAAVVKAPTIVNFEAPTYIAAGSKVNFVVELRSNLNFEEEYSVYVVVGDASSTVDAKVIPAFGTETFNVTLSIPKTMPYGTYVVELYVTYANTTSKFSLTSTYIERFCSSAITSVYARVVNVTETHIVYDVTVDAAYETNFKATLKVLYEVYNGGYATSGEASASVSVGAGTVPIEFEVSVPLSWPAGNYTLRVTLTSLNSTDTREVTIEVPKVFKARIDVGNSRVDTPTALPGQYVNVTVTVESLSNAPGYFTIYVDIAGGVSVAPASTNVYLVPGENVTVTLSVKLSYFTPPGNYSVVAYVVKDNETLASEVIGRVEVGKFVKFLMESLLVEVDKSVVSPPSVLKVSVSVSYITNFNTRCVVDAILLDAEGNSAGRGVNSTTLTAPSGTLKVSVPVRVVGVRKPGVYFVYVMFSTEAGATSWINSSKYVIVKIEEYVKLVKVELVNPDLGTPEIDYSKGKTTVLVKVTYEIQLAEPDTLTIEVKFLKNGVVVLSKSVNYYINASEEIVSGVYTKKVSIKVDRYLVEGYYDLECSVLLRRVGSYDTVIVGSALHVAKYADLAISINKPKKFINPGEYLNLTGAAIIFANFNDTLNVVVTARHTSVNCTITAVPISKSVDAVTGLYAVEVFIPFSRTVPITIEYPAGAYKVEYLGTYGPFKRSGEVTGFIVTVFVSAKIYWDATVPTCKGQYCLIEPGKDTVEYLVSITNLGNANATFIVTIVLEVVRDVGNYTLRFPYELPVTYHGSLTQRISIRVPDNMPAGELLTYLEVRSINFTWVSAPKFLGHVKELVSLVVKPVVMPNATVIGGLPAFYRGDTVSVVLNITNSGNVEGPYTVVVIDVDPSGIETVVANYTLTGIKSGESTLVPLNIKIPDTAIAGKHIAKLRIYYKGSEVCAMVLLEYLVTSVSKELLEENKVIVIYGGSELTVIHVSILVLVSIILGVLIAVLLLRPILKVARVFTSRAVPRRR